MKPSELVTLLQECYRERLAQMDRHRAVAAHVADYDSNNTYQYVINREETHLAWLRDAIAALGGTVPEPAGGPSITLDGGKDAWLRLVSHDAQTGRDFVAKWQPRVESLTHARNRTMLRLMLGEIQEQVRFFDQVAAGQVDPLGRRDAGAIRRGVVGAARWLGD